MSSLVPPHFTRTAARLLRRVVFPSACALVLATSVRAQSVTDPRITSWQTAKSALYARVYESAAKFSAGTTNTTWPTSGLVTSPAGGVATVTYSDVQRVAYSSTYVYIYTTGLPSYAMGNWLTPNGMTYTSFPSNRAAIHRIPRTPTIPTTKQKNNGSGGVLVNGVYVWQNGDAQSYANASSTASTATISMSGDGIWNRLAGVAETFNFDPALGHQPNNGAYHNHINPIALRYQLGDNITYSASTKTYAEAATPTAHSPILGWANDGLPIYGPYGYSSAMDSGSGVRRMTTGFTKRDGTLGTVNLATTGRTTLPVWAASVQGKSQTLTVAQYGPTTTATYALGPVSKTCSIGTFTEDYEYLGDLGKTQGVDFDLNRQNVRFCVTPEFPAGTYAYFVCIDATGTTVFPDVINQEYFGTASAGQGTVTSISETVTDYVAAGPAATITVTGTASGGNVALSWNSAEGATYKVESSADNSTFTTLSSAVTSGGLTTTYTATGSTNYYRVTLTAIATYDTGGTFGTPVGKTATLTFGASANAPAITTAPGNQTVTAGTSVTFTVVASGSAALTYQWKKSGANISGATAASYTIASPVVADSGSYTVTVTNSVGSATSTAATLTVNAAATAPSITTPPASVTVTAGAGASFTVVASGTAPLTYQWLKNSAAISGATNANHVIAATVAADAGSYAVTVTNSAGSATSTAATLTVNPISTEPVKPPATTAARIVNLAVRTPVGGVAGSPITGFVLGGTGAGKRMIVRAVGPTLGGFGVTGTLADPRLQLFRGETLLGSNDNWLAADAAAFAAVGAFPLVTGGTDAALVATLAPGAYTTPVFGAGGASGTVLIECYDGADSDGSVSLVNASARAYVGTGGDVLIPGFVIVGEGSVRLLLRAVGPGLTAFGVTGALADPQLTLFRGSVALQENDNWSTAANAAETVSAAAGAGAFPLVGGSRDAALVVALGAGSYTVLVSGVAGGTGTALVEVYVVR